MSFSLRCVPSWNMLGLTSMVAMAFASLFGGMLGDEYSPSMHILRRLAVSSHFVVIHLTVNHIALLDFRPLPEPDTISWESKFISLLSVLFSFVNDCPASSLQVVITDMGILTPSVFFPSDSGYDSRWSSRKRFHSFCAVT